MVRHLERGTGLCYWTAQGVRKPGQGVPRGAPGVELPQAVMNTLKVMLLVQAGMKQRYGLCPSSLSAACTSPWCLLCVAGYEDNTSVVMMGPNADLYSLSGSKNRSKRATMACTLMSHFIPPSSVGHWLLLLLKCCCIWADGWRAVCSQVCMSLPALLPHTTICHRSDGADTQECWCFQLHEHNIVSMLASLPAPGFACCKIFWEFRQCKLCNRENEEPTEQARMQTWRCCYAHDERLHQHFVCVSAAAEL